jgi:hypothetical protein
MTAYEYRKKDPLYGAAIVAVTLELKGGDRALDREIVDGTCRDLGIERAALDRYIHTHRADLEATVRREGLV